MCSIHLDDATAAILRQNAHHTPTYWWRGDRVMKPISVWEWLGGHGGQRPIGKLARMPGLHPYSFAKDISSFLMTTESQDVGLTSHPKADGFGHSMCLGHTHHSSSLRGDSFHCRTCRSGSIHFSLWIHSWASYCSQIHSRARSNPWVHSTPFLFCSQRRRSHFFLPVLTLIFPALLPCLVERLSLHCSPN